MIFSTVRSNKDGGLGFLSNERRINVALTRAKHGMIILGNKKTLESDPNWKDLIEMCRIKGHILTQLSQITHLFDRFSQQSRPAADPILNPAKKKFDLSVMFTGAWAE